MYQIFEHTADLGIRVCTGSLDELFVDAARTVLVMVANLDAVRTVKEVRFQFTARATRNFCTTGWRNCYIRFAPAGWCWRSSRESREKKGTGTSRDAHFSASAVTARSQSRFFRFQPRPVANRSTHGGTRSMTR